jgi:hypothetical protein
MQQVKDHQPMEVSELQDLQSLLRSLLADSRLMNGLSLLERHALESSAQIVQSLSRKPVGGQHQERS